MHLFLNLKSLSLLKASLSSFKKSKFKNISNEHTRSSIDILSSGSFFFFKVTIFIIIECQVFTNSNIFNYNLQFQRWEILFEVIQEENNPPSIFPQRKRKRNLWRPVAKRSPTHVGFVIRVSKLILSWSITLPKSTHNSNTNITITIPHLYRQFPGGGKLQFL